ncbi:MAG: SUF system Fe-S cluster assembly protein [Alphaproteobacteria bacterium]|nr:SUF system Fe-S cluster assembly protein [Alphaproteobacteria bacterium]MDE2335734.1 SUF system Fe-S cluster assembly protein [Alphaproteobacteria bacterium]
MLRNAYGDEDMEKLRQPSYTVASREHKLWPLVQAALREVYDPEIPVNIYELGLIYKVDIDEKNDVFIEMTLTSPGCPVAGEMPGMVENAVGSVETIGSVKVEIIWDPPWDPSKMAETAKLQLNMF